jgi:hypothetical protein
LGGVESGSVDGHQINRTRERQFECTNRGATVLVEVGAYSEGPHTARVSISKPLSIAPYVPPTLVRCGRIEAQQPLAVLEKGSVMLVPNTGHPSVFLKPQVRFIS